MSLDFAPQPKYQFKVFSHRFRPSWMLEAGVEPSRRASPIFCCRSFLVFAFFSSDFFVQGEVSFVRQIKTLLFLCYVRIGAHEVMVVFFDQTIILGQQPPCPPCFDLSSFEFVWMSSESYSSSFRPLIFLPSIQKPFWPILVIFSGIYALFDVLLQVEIMQWCTNVNKYEVWRAGGGQICTRPGLGYAQVG